MKSPDNLRDIILVKIDLTTQLGKPSLPARQTTVEEL